MTAAFIKHAAHCLVLAAACGAVQADDIDAGRIKARGCVVCHGPLGLATMPETPNLAGQPASYVSAQLKAYRSGARKHEIMGLMAKPLSDDDIVQIAAWFAAIRIEPIAPR